MTGPTPFAPARPDPDPSLPFATSTPDYGDLAVVLTGGGARGAYQVGLLRYVARRFPELHFPVLVGTSAGALNATHLAQHQGTLSEAVESLAGIWRSVTAEQVFRVDALSLTRNTGRWLRRLVSGGGSGESNTRGLVDTDPMREMLERVLSPEEGKLPGVEENIRRGRLRALAVSTTNYTTGDSIVWVQGREIEMWERPKRRAIQTDISVEHVMASAALPIFFPAVRIGSHWYGDGGIRLTAPLSPALHLGARRILTIATRHRPRVEPGVPQIRGYPPPAQVLGVLYNSIFLDLIDQDAVRLERVNRLLAKIPPDEREGNRIVDLLVIRPSQDLSAIAGEYEPKLPRPIRFMTRGLGTRETSSPDILGLLMFQEDYITRLIELGEADAEAQADRIEAFLAGETERQRV